MDEQRAVAAQFQTHLTDGLQERQRFDVAHRAADFHQGDIRLAGAEADAALDFVGDVRDDLHRAAEVIAAPFLADDVFVDAPGGEIVAPAGGQADKAFVMAEIEIGFRPVTGHEHLAVLKRTHGAGINVDVGVELDQGDFQTPCFEHGGQRGGGDTLAERGDHAAGDENESGHAGWGVAKRRYTIPDPAADSDCQTGRRTLPVPANREPGLGNRYGTFVGFPANGFAAWPKS